MSGLLPSLWDSSDPDAAPFNSLQREIDRVFNDFSRNFGAPRTSPYDEPGALLFPRTDVVENDNALEITTELPGVSNEDVEVTIVENTLTIRGEKKAEKKEEKDDHRMIERSYGSFKRSLRLPFAVSADQIDAQFKDGILKLVLPKPPEIEAKTQKIAIKSATH